MTANQRHEGMLLKNYLHKSLKYLSTDKSTLCHSVLFAPLFLLYHLLGESKLN